jgi:Holliday junction resolvase RusA-like endonuclease
MSAGDEEQDVFRVTLPLPPSVNRSLRPAKLGIHGMRLVHTRESQVWASLAAIRLRGVKKPEALKRGPVAITLRVRVPSIASDGGNRLKPLEDALVRAGVLSDDRQIAEWHLTKEVAKGADEVDVELRPADPAKHPELAKRLAQAEGKKGAKP